MSNKIIFALGRLAIVGVLFAGGCGSAGEAYCTTLCECVGCTEGEWTQCIGDQELQDDYYVSNSECSGEYDDYLNCVADSAVCKDDNLELDSCETEAEALDDCTEKRHDL